jgi:hypothetical protein
MRVPEKRKDLAAGIEDPSLLGVQREPESGHDVVEPLHFPDRVRGCQQDKIIRIADESPVQRTARHLTAEIPIEQVQVHVCQKG